MIKSVIFDLDNTLVDFLTMKQQAVIAAVDAMIEAGLTVPKDEMVARVFATYEKEGIEDQRIFNKILQELLGRIDYKILAAGIYGYRQAKDGTLKLYPHVRLTLTELLRMGVRMMVLSDAPRIQAWLRIYAVGLADFFEQVIAYEDTGERKPSPRPFKKAMEVLNLPSHEILMLGDWAERDIVGAKRLGMRTVFARYGDVKNTAQSGADADITDIIQLVDIIRDDHARVRAEGGGS